MRISQLIQKMVLGKLDMPKNQTGLLSCHAKKKKKFKMDTDLSVKPETIKLVEENIGSMLCEIGLISIF